MVLCHESVSCDKSPAGRVLYTITSKLKFTIRIVFYFISSLRFEKFFTILCLHFLFYFPSLLTYISQFFVLNTLVQLIPTQLMLICIEPLEIGKTKPLIGSMCDTLNSFYAQDERNYYRRNYSSSESYQLYSYCSNLQRSAYEIAN